MWATTVVEGSLEAKLPTIWTDGKALQLGRSSDVEEMRKGEDAGAPKGREGANTVFFRVFPMFCASGGSKSRLAKAAGAEPFGQMKDEKPFGQSTLASQNVQSTSGSDRFWKLRW